MSSRSVAVRLREAEIERKHAEALAAPAVSWQAMRDVLDEIDDMLTYASALAAKRATLDEVNEVRAKRRRLRKIAEQGLGSFVYVLKRPRRRLVKIGVTSDVKRRMSALATGSGEPLELLLAVPGERQEEKGLHERFAQYRRHGEWFEYSREIERWVREARITRSARV